jgi:hypothetical protein
MRYLLRTRAPKDEHFMLIIDIRTLGHHCLRSFAANVGPGAPIIIEMADR